MFCRANAALPVTLLLLSWVAGCDAEADVVAAPIGKQGSSQDAGPADGGPDAGHCELATRFHRVHLPAFALDLILDCEVSFSALQGSQAPQTTQISAEQFKELISAPQLESDGGAIGEALCRETPIGWYFEPFDHPDRGVLCPAACDLFRQQIKRVLAQDGCDGPYDASMPPIGFPGGSGFPGGGMTGGDVQPSDDDAGGP